MELIIGNYNYSSWSMRPWLFVHKYSLPLKVIRYDLDTPEMHNVLSERFSNGKVPVLVGGDTDIWDSLAILEYLGERFPHTNPWPDSLEARSAARSVSAEMHSSFSALRSEAPMNIRRCFPGYELSEAAILDLVRIQALWQYCRERFGSTGPWLFGQFSIADAMFAPVVMRFRSVSVNLNQVAAAYCETVTADASVREWIRRGLEERNIVERDEIDWQSKPVTDI